MKGGFYLKPEKGTAKIRGKFPWIPDMLFMLGCRCCLLPKNQTGATGANNLAPAFCLHPEIGHARRGLNFCQKRE